MKFKILSLLAIAGLVALLPSTARADGFSYNFGACPSGFTCPGAIGTSQIYTSNGVTITAYGFSSTNLADNLYVKQSGGDETGLGLVGTSDFEIQHGNFIQLNMSNLTSAGVISGFLTLGSVQIGEGYQICDSSALGVMNGACFTGTLDGQPVGISWDSAHPYITITATTGDVLVAQAFSTPEPGTMGMTLLGAGLLVLFGMRRRSPADVA
jgi:hypothetical protein